MLPNQTNTTCFHIYRTSKQYEQAGYPQPKIPQGLSKRLSSTFLTSLLQEDLYASLFKSALVSTLIFRFRYLFAIGIPKVQPISNQSFVSTDGNCVPCFGKSPK